MKPRNLKAEEVLGEVSARAAKLEHKGVFYSGIHASRRSCGTVTHCTLTRVVGEIGNATCKELEVPACEIVTAHEIGGGL